MFVVLFKQGGNNVGIQFRISEEKRAKGKSEGQNEPLTKRKRTQGEMKGEGERRLGSDENEGNKHPALEQCLAWENNFSRENKLLSAPAWLKDREFSEPKVQFDF